MSVVNLTPFNAGGILHSEKTQSTTPPPPKKKKPKKKIQKFYAVFGGQNQGVYRDWTIAERFSKGQKKTRVKGFFVE